MTARPYGTQHNPRTSSTPCARRLAAIGLVAVAALATISGCMQPLLPSDVNRSPFDDYDRVRGQAASQKALDDFGIEKPNLRERLAPRD